jgi:Fe-S cluster assembly iron-binding protein IscA
LGAETAGHAVPINFLLQLESIVDLLRASEAVKRALADLIQNECKLPEAQIEVADGGARGMHVTVTLPEENRSDVTRVQDALAEYLFSATVEIE